MKYWLLTTEFPPQYGGGIGTYCAQWSQLLCQKGNEVTVFIPNISIEKYQVTYRNHIRIIEFSPYLTDTSSYLGYETMISYSFAAIVEEIVKKDGVPDWIEAQEYNGIAYYILQKRHLGYDIFKDLRVLITCHCPSFLTFEHNHVSTYKLPYFWIGEMEKFCIQAADVCISPSRYLIAALCRKFTLNNPIHVLHNPYAFEAYDTDLPVSDTAVFLAKLSPAKGVLYAVKCFKQLWDDGCTIKLKLIGDPYYFYHALQITMGSYLKKKYVRYIKLGLLQITGVLEPESVKEEVRSAKMVLVPSTIENFPYTVVECMAQGKVVLASKQGGQIEIIEDGKNGFLFDYAEEDSFTQKVKHIASLTQQQLFDIGKKAGDTIRECCNGDAYYIRKIALLQKHTPVEPKTVFPFVTGLPCREPEESINHIKEQKERLSIVIPYYNMGTLVYETINAINNSSYTNKEVILVNDGSDEEASLEVLNILRQRGDIQIVDQPNKGLPAARNAGALKATGEYLAFLDADDLVNAQYYAKAIAVLKSKTNVHFIGCWIQYFENSTNIWPAFNPELPYLLYHNMVNSSSLVYKKRSFLKAGLNDRRFIYGMEDYDSVISMVKSGYHGVVLPETLFYYRIRKNSMARGFNTENKSYIYQLLTAKHKHVYATFAAEITNLLNVNGPGYAIDNPTLDYHLYSGNAPYNKIIRKVITKIKTQPQLRKVALTIKRKLQ